MENTSNGSRQVIAEAIRKIALGRSVERIGIGTARMIHGYVAKVHDNSGDSEYEEYAGTIDVGEFPDETASSEPVIHKGVLLAGLKDNSGGFLIIPTLFSDVTIVTDAATKYAYVLNYSHAKVIQLSSHDETVIGVTQTEELDAGSNDSPDYDELEKTGNESSTRYTAEKITSIVKNKDGKEVIQTLEPELISTKVDKSEVTQTTGKVQQKLGNQLAQLMLEFLTECSKITTPTLMGTMPAVNVPNFASLISKIQNFLSKTSYTQ